MDKLKELYADPRHALLSEALKVLESARVWNGQEYSYSYLHPVKYLPLRDKIKQELTTLAMEHGFYEDNL